MTQLFRCLALLTRRRKQRGADLERPQDSDIVPLPSSVDSLGAAGSHSPDAHRPLHGAQVDIAGRTVESAVCSVSNSPSDLPAARLQAITLESLPAELRRLILAHVAHDLVALRALVDASPVFYQQYLVDRAVLLRAGLRTALGDSVVDAYAVQTSARIYESAADARQHAQVPLETIMLFINNYTALRLSALPDAILDDLCTEEDLLGMAAFYYALARPLALECAIRFLDRLDASLEVGDLSPVELSRLVRALSRWQLYCNLFGQGREGCRKVTHPGLGEHLDVFFCIFRPWEIEEIYCVFLLLMDTYSDLVDAVAWDFNIDNPKYHFWPNPLPPGAWDFELPSIRESAIDGLASRGLLLFSDAVAEDDHDDLVELMEYYLVHGDNILQHTFSWVNQFFRRERRVLEVDLMETRRQRLPFVGDAEDQPPLAWVIFWRGRYSNRYGEAVRPGLQRWGYVFWDRKRLIQIKGTQEVLRERKYYVRL